MPFLKFKLPSRFFALWSSVINLLMSEPKILVPFVFLGILETIAVFVLSCAPHFPVNVLLAPPVRRIWGETYLHYPYIYELLPRMFYFGKIVIGIFFGAMTTAMAVSMAASARAKKKVCVKEAFLAVLPRYVSLFILAVILYGTVHFVMKQPPFLLVRFFRTGATSLLFAGPKTWFDVILPVFNFFLAIILQSLFIYAIPFIVLKGKKFIPAFFMGIGFFFRKFLKTLAIIAAPMILYIPVTMVRSNMSFVADKLGPESVIGIILAGILVGTVIVDALVTVATTLFFLEATDEK
jgi:hypothetical protein